MKNKRIVIYMPETEHRKFLVKAGRCGKSLSVWAREQMMDGVHPYFHGVPAPETWKDARALMLIGKMFMKQLPQI